MFDTLVYYIPHSNDIQNGQMFLMEVDSSKKDELMKYLKLFKVKRKVELEDVKDQFRLFAINNFCGDAAKSPLNLESNVDKTNLILNYVNVIIKFINNDSDGTSFEENLNEKYDLEFRSFTCVILLWFEYSR